MNPANTADKLNYQAAPRQFCAKCNNINATNGKACSQCGKRLETVRRIRVTGAISVALGAILLGAFGWLAIWIYAAASNNSPNGAAFQGEARDFGFVVIVFGLVIAICVFGIVAGLWQLIFGTRNKILKYIVLILGIVFIGMGLTISFSKPF